MKKKRNKNQDTKSFITPSLHLCFEKNVALLVMNALGKEENTKTSSH